jgi:hypothetical protein
MLSISQENEIKKFILLELNKHVQIFDDSIYLNKCVKGTDEPLINEDVNYITGFYMECIDDPIEAFIRDKAYYSNSLKFKKYILYLILMLKKENLDILNGIILHIVDIENDKFHYDNDDINKFKFERDKQHLICNMFDVLIECKSQVIHRKNKNIWNDVLKNKPAKIYNLDDKIFKNMVI